MIFDESSFDLGEKFLEHYGVKGMHWGIRKEEELVGREKGTGEDPTDDEIRAAQLEAKYGKGSMSGDKGLSDKQKKALLIGGGIIAGAAVLGAGYFGLKKYDEFQVDQQLKRAIADRNLLRAPLSIPGVTDVQAFVKKYPNLEHDPARAFDLATSVNMLVNRADKGPPEHFGGIFTHWDQGVELAAGTVVQRLSTEKERTIRPDGFFAAFDPGDVKRYIAELPNWWQRWGYADTDGYLTQLKSKKAIKAPSGKQSVQILADMISENFEEFASIMPQGVVDLPAGPTRDKAIFGFALNDFQGFSGAWTTKGAQLMPNVRKYLDRVRQSGYDALIDFNDSGTIARTPMRFLSGSSLFDIIGNVPVSADDIDEARRTLTDLVMSGLDLGENFLAHYGKKGMHWGIRKALPNGGARFWANAATRTVAKGKKPTSPYLGVVGGYGRAAGLGLKKHPAFAIAGGAAVAALVAGTLFAKYQKKKVASMPPTNSVDTRGSIFVTRSFTVNSQPVTMNSIQNYRLWPHSQLQN